MWGVTSYGGVRTCIRELRVDSPCTPGPHGQLFLTGAALKKLGRSSSTNRDSAAHPPVMHMGDVTEAFILAGLRALLRSLPIKADLQFLPIKGYLEK